MDFSKTLIHGSSLYKLAVQPQSKEAKERGELSATAKTHLIEIYVQEKYGRTKDINALAMKKGTAVEKDAITLLSRHDKEMYRKNTEILSNEYIIGTPDVRYSCTIGENKIKSIKDTKCSWDLFTFKEELIAPIDKSYYWQLQGYMSLDHADEGEIAHCLIDTPDFLIEDYIRVQMYKLPESMRDFITETSTRQMKFADVPLHERVIRKQVYRCQEDIDKIPDMVTKAREFLQQLDAADAFKDIEPKL